MYEVDRISSHDIPLQNGYFTLTPSKESTDTLSFSVLQVTREKMQPLQNVLCSDFGDKEQCFNDSFCLSSCHYVACNITYSIIVPKDSSDSSILELCLTDAPIRYELGIADQQAILPAVVVFSLTILSGLLAVFVVIVLHYNCLVLFRNKLPYVLPCRCCCPFSEMYFPFTIDEE